jgi:hypothetical protein
MSFAPTLVPESVEFPPEVYITPFSRTGMWAVLSGSASGALSSGSPLANLATYLPIFLPRTVIAYRLFALNGATAGGTNNRDIGIYRSDSNRLPSTLVVSSGGVAISGASVCQYANITDTTLIGPALYWLAHVMSGITDTVFRNNEQTFPQGAAVLVQTSAYPLPSTATPVASTSNHVIPMCGIALRATP